MRGGPKRPGWQWPEVPGLGATVVVGEVLDPDADDDAVGVSGEVVSVDEGERNFEVALPGHRVVAAVGWDET